MTRKLVKHGDTKRPLYGVWRHMIDRCYKPNQKYYHCYGGRGITVCAKWRDSYLAFREWAIVSGYSEGLSIDRVDNNKGYSPANCWWANAKEQGRNRRTSRFVTAFGKTKTLTDWSEETGISRFTIAYRLKCGWPIEETLTRKPWTQRA